MGGSRPVAWGISMRRLRRGVARALAFSVVGALALLATAPPPAGAAPAPSGFVAAVAVDGNGRCVTTVSWQGGHGNIYIVERLVNTSTGHFGQQAAKVATAGDPRGSGQYQYTWPQNPAGFGSGDFRVDVSVYDAKGQDGAHGDLIAETSSGAQTATCS
jgi:hypothetical protein